MEVRVRAGRRGISLLLEVMLGIGIFSTCLLLLFGLFPTANTSLAMDRDISQATNIARDKAEELRVAGFFDPRTATPAVTAGSTQTYAPVLVKGKAVINGVPVETDYQVDYTVAVGNPDTNLKLITVRVKWTVGAAGAGGFNRQVEVETYVTSH